MITGERCSQLATQFGKDSKNTGLTEVQVAILSERIQNLSPHFDKHKLDYHSKRGLMKMIGKRRRLLRYVRKQSEERYRELIGTLKLRK